MLRCNNVNALRTSVGSTAIRAALGPRCTRTFLSRSSAAPFSSPSARQVLALPQKGPWKPLGDARAYSSDHSDLPKDDSKPQSTAERSRPFSRPEPDDERLFALAMSNEAINPELSDKKLSRAVVEMELVWLKDPKALADRVRDALDAGEEALGVALVRSAQSQGIECGAAWNFLLEYCMYKKKSSWSAFRFYNDMKKRGRKPSARTYTIMLNGLSKTPSRRGFNPVEIAMSIYQSISGPTSKVRRSIFHGNAMLSVCARHGDMDKLWQVASELPEEGPDSPGPATYTIILRAIQNSIIRDVKAMPPKDTKAIAARRAHGVTEAKQVWTDITYRWKKGELVLDHLMLDSMANVLVEGPDEYNIYEILVLLNQTTGLPILAKEPRKISYKTNSVMPPNGAQVGAYRKDMDLEEDVPFVDEGETLYRPPKTGALEEEEAEADEENLDDVFKPVFPDDPSSGVIGPWHVPMTNRELFIVLKACSTLPQALGDAQDYWKLMVQDDSKFKVQPDQRSYIEYLRILQRARASRAATELIRNEALPANLVRSEMFVSAFKACRRDIFNINVLKHANELLELMTVALPVPNIKALDIYYNLVSALLEKPQLLHSLNFVPEDDETINSITSLSALGLELRTRLKVTACEALRPHAFNLEQVLDHTEGRLAQSPYELAKPPRDEDFSALDAVIFLARFRGLVHNILKTENAHLVVPRRNIRRYEIMELRMNKFCGDAGVRRKFKGKLVTATSLQKFRAREARERFLANEPRDPVVDPVDVQADTEVNPEAEAETDTQANTLGETQHDLSVGSTGSKESA